MPPNSFDFGGLISPKMIAQYQKKIDREIAETEDFLRSALEDHPETPLDLETKVLETRLSLMESLFVRYKKGRHLDHLIFTSM